MSIFVPLKKGITLCKAFEKLSSWTWNTMRETEKMEFEPGEETLTDLIMLALARRLPHKVHVKKFNRTEEGKSGADWLWCFVGANDCFVMQVQAKRIHEGKYHSLDHRIGKKKSKRWQVDVLIKNAKKRKAFPAYVFYNFLPSTLRVGVKPKPCREHWGCSAASALQIKPDVKARKKHFTDHYGNMKPWREIVCGKADAAKAANAFAASLMGPTAYHGLFPACVGLPTEVKLLVDDYKNVKSKVKGSMSPGDRTSQIKESDDLDSNDQHDGLAGIALIGDFENSCLMRTS